MPNINDFYPSNYLRAADLGGKEVDVTIDRVTSEDFEQDVHQLAADAGERGVALAVADRLRQHLVPMFEGLAGFAVAALRRGDHGQQPIRCRGKVARRIDRPRIWPAARVDRGWRNDVPAVAADIETDAELTDAVANLVLAGAEVAMAALAGDRLDGGRQDAVRLFKQAQRGFWQAQWAIPSRRKDQGGHCRAAEIQRVAENAPRWPDVKLVMARRISNGSQTRLEDRPSWPTNIWLI